MMQDIRDVERTFTTNLLAGARLWSTLSEITRSTYFGIGTLVAECIRREIESGWDVPLEDN